MIRSFRDVETGKLFREMKSKRFQGIEKVATRKLFLLDSATSLQDLRSPGNSLEALRRERAGQHSIRINDQFRVCFVWKDGDAYQVEITDYH